MNFPAETAVVKVSKSTRRRRAFMPILTGRLKAALCESSTDDEALGAGDQAECAFAFLPWVASDTKSLDLGKLAKAIGADILDPPSRLSGTTDSAYIAHLARFASNHVANDLERQSIAEVIEVLDRFPSTVELKRSALQRLQPVLQRQRLMIAAFPATDITDGWVSWLREALTKSGLRRAIVVGRSPSNHRDAIIQLNLAEMVHDLGTVIDDDTVDTTERDASVPASELRGDQSRSVWQRFVRPKSRPAAAQHPAPAARPEVGGLARFLFSLLRRRKIRRDPWIRTIARLTYPNLGLAKEILDIQFTRAEERANKFAPNGGAPNGQSRAQDLGAAGSEEFLVLRGRLRFVGALRSLYKELIERVQNDLDGADQLYRLLLIIGGRSAADSLLSGALARPWLPYLNDYVFCEFARSAFREIDGCSVRRFESRSQLFWHVRYFVQAATGRNTAFEELRDGFTRWITVLHKQMMSGELANSQLEAELKNPAFPGSNWQKFDKSTKSNAAELLQVAQMLLSVDELEGKPRWAREIHALLDDAVNLSRGAVFTDSSLIRARTYVIEQKIQPAQELLQNVKRLGDDLVKAAVGVEEGFIAEARGDYWDAIRRYGRALKKAEELAADELMTRSMLGWLRSDALIKAGRQQAGGIESKVLRARCLVQIQTARAPNLFVLSGRSKPIVFLSYRRSTAALTECIHAGLKGSRLDSWTDQQLTAERGNDFGAIIHRQLLDADAIALLLSPSFFKSPWCIHELHFALGQHEVRGIPLYWTWCRSPKSVRVGHPVNIGLDWDSSPLEAARLWLKRSDRSTDGPELLEHRRFHEQDRILRIIDHGRRLTAAVVPIEACKSDDRRSDVDTAGVELAAKEAVEVLLRDADELYKRAGLD